MERRVCNAYGPSEATVCASIAVWPEGDWLTGQRVHLGHPLPHVQLYVLDERLEPVPIGVPGEVCIGGIGLARGYQGRAAETAQVFVPHPFSAQPGARLYRTGDRGRWHEDGHLEYLGREDGQVKLRGYRIELGEIEARLREHEAVGEAVVMLHEHETLGQHIVAYVTTVSEQEELGEELREWLQQQVPDYLVPAFIVVLEAWPLTSSGKIDRQALLQQTANLMLVTEQPGVQAARTPIEALIAACWCEVLELEQIGLEENFFDLGGHSLLAARVVMKLQAVMQIEIPVRHLFEALTVAALAQVVEQLLRGGQAVVTPPLVPVSRTQPLPLSFAQQRLWFLDQLQPGGTVYLMPISQRLHGPMHVRALEQSLEELQRRHESLRTTFLVHEGEPVQVIHPAQPFCLPVIDLQGLHASRREYEGRRLAQQEGQRPCDLTQGPLLRTYLLRLQSQEHVFLQTMHHIISDGWSNDVFVRELSQLYQAAVDGVPLSLPALPIQYADFAMWQRQWLQGEILEEQLAYWKRQLADISVLDLPTDHPHPPIQTFRGTYQVAHLSASLSKRTYSVKSAAWRYAVYNVASSLPALANAL